MEKPTKIDHLVSGDIPSPKVIFRPSTATEEFERLKNNLGKQQWYKEHGYEIGIDVILPLSHSTFSDLIGTGTDISILENDEIFKTFQEREIDSTFYDSGIKRLEQDQSHILEALSRFKKLHQQWGFKLFPQYEIILTKFGTGGSYNENTGMVILLANEFGIHGKRNPGAKVIHELIHLGIEELIVEPNQLTQYEKERLVDRIYFAGFLDIIPEYTYQYADLATEMDDYITPDSLDNLPSAVEKYVANYPRKS